jgi:hypothetical protein
MVFLVKCGTGDFCIKWLHSVISYTNVTPVLISRRCDLVYKRCYIIATRKDWTFKCYASFHNEVMWYGTLSTCDKIY